MMPFSLFDLFAMFLVLARLTALGNLDMGELKDFTDFGVRRAAVVDA